VLAAALAGRVGAADDPPRPPSLKTVAVPEPANLGEFVRDRTAAIVLGKALFWDMQVGSDGVQACASCHFRAGADPRSRNQVNPGSRRIAADGVADPDTTFEAPLAPNRTLQASDFPLSPGSNDVVSSQGIARFVFGGLLRTGERLLVVPDMDGFRVGEVNVRRVEARNTPSVVNAVFNHRNFWDGRAANVFNGVNGLGDDDPDAHVYRAAADGSLHAVRVRLEDSSLASQAVMPPVSDTEMAASGRRFTHIAAELMHGWSETGKRLALRRPLGGQRVHRDDSVLGPWSRSPAPGLRVPGYEKLVQQAFHETWWRSHELVRTHPDGSTTVVDRRDRNPATEEHTLLEQNFALFFGLAIQLYQATLVADDAPYDRFMDGDATAVGPAVLRGVDLFRSQTRGRCINCHEGAELTGASVRRVRESPTRIREGQALDRGFNNIGILPTLEDPGVGGDDALGNPLSTVRRLDPPPAEPIAVDGAMKVPGLRNVALTAPYFHTGGFRTLGEVLAFYSRGGDVRPQLSSDGTLEIAGLAVLDNTPEELADLEAFLVALTDERVLRREAPFDHPQLFVPDGHQGDEAAVVDDGTGTARDRLREIPAVGGRGGRPLRGFLE
jgi:cytochrome c peroxidase